MPRMSPSELAAKWAQKYGASTEAYKAGIAKVQDNPAQKAVAAQDRMVANFNDAVSSGKWAAGLNKVTLQSWKQAATEKGAPAIAAAARVGADKVAKAEAIMGPIRDSIVASLPERGTIEQNLERARQMALKMNQARKSG